MEPVFGEDVRVGEGRDDDVERFAETPRRELQFQSISFPFPFDSREKEVTYVE